MLLIHARMMHLQLDTALIKIIPENSNQRCFNRRRSGDNVWTDEKVKRKKPCTGVHSIGTATATCAATDAVVGDVTAAAGTTSTTGITSVAVTTNTAATTSTAAAASTVVIAAAAAAADTTCLSVVSADEHLCVSMSPTEEPVQLLHKRLPVPARPARRPDDLLASRLIDRFVDQICMDDGTLTRGGGGGPGDRMSIVSPLAKRLADIRLRRSPPTVEATTAALKRKRTPSFGTSSSDDDGGPHWPRTPAAAAGRRPTPWWWQYSGGHTLPSDGLPSPFHSSRPRHRRRRPPPLAVPHSPITPLRARDPEDSDDYWKTPVGRRSPLAAVRDSLLSTASSRTVDDDVIACDSDPRSPAVLDETFTLKSRRCLSFASPPPPTAKKRNPRPKSSRRAAATPDKGESVLRPN